MTTVYFGYLEILVSTAVQEEKTSIDGESTGLDEK